VEQQWPQEIHDGFPMDKVGDSSWVEISGAALRLRVEFTEEGWAYSAYDLKSKTYLLLPQAANTEEQGQFLAERWAIGAGLLDVRARLNWTRNMRD
jgi:hypothetical protein